MESLNDSEAKEPVYLDLPKVSYKNAVVSWKDTFEELNEHWADKENYGRYWNDGDDRCGEKKKEIEDIDMQLMQDWEDIGGVGNKLTPEEIEHVAVTMFGCPEK